MRTMKLHTETIGHADRVTGNAVEYATERLMVLDDAEKTVVDMGGAPTPLMHAVADYLVRHSTETKLSPVAEERFAMGVGALCDAMHVAGVYRSDAPFEAFFFACGRLNHAPESTTDFIEQLAKY